LTFASFGFSSETTVQLDGRAVLPKHGTVAGFWLFAEDEGAQLAMMGHPPRRAVASLDRGRRLTIQSELGPTDEPSVLSVRARPLSGAGAKVTLQVGSNKPVSALVNRMNGAHLRMNIGALSQPAVLSILIEAPSGGASVRLDGLKLADKPLPLNPRRRVYPEPGAVAGSPSFRPAIETSMIEWDWRMQDGIATPREPRTYSQAIAAILPRGESLLRDLAAQGVSLDNQTTAWAALRGRYDALKQDPAATDAQWEALWLEVHRLRREIVLANPLADIGPLVFAKRVPSTMAHQLTQYYGYTAQPGGGLFVLEKPGRSMRVRSLSASMPEGSYLHPEVSFEGTRVYFALCQCDRRPATSWGDPNCLDRRYHLCVVNADGTQARRLTDGPFDDFSPTCLPNGKLLFSSTRRGGYHRCGRGPCYVYTLALAEADGSNPHPISFHETNEWDPALLHDGRVIYTRWDYVDRDAVFYQQLWTVQQDGSHVSIYYGNNTYNPVGTWEARPVPGSTKVMATAAPHHGMTAGSIILLDVKKGVDGPKAITRLTPDAPFPESEIQLMRGKPVSQPTQFDDPQGGGWGPTGREVAADRKVLREERRWPGHCYRSPYPLSERYFLAAYSYDRLRGEAGTNLSNMFGLYLCDAFGNKELLYRDPNISSQWPIPLRLRKKPPVVQMPNRWDGGDTEKDEGTFFVHNIYNSWPQLPDVKIRRIRIVQVLPKTTPHANNPRVGAANASPGKQVLGTVPVEPDGSAYFRAPARIPILFQALDDRGRAVQTMRSLTYLQPGEAVSCVGCHEPRTAVPQNTKFAKASVPSTIVPGPDGSNPLSYPILVQSVLDRHCVECHNAKKPEGKVILTGEPEGTFTKSYNVLIHHVAYTAWGMPHNNYEPLTEPDRFGARASRLVELLDKGHYDVKLSDDEWDRLVTWIDANALFYGTFDPKDQAKQQRGERIAGPALE